MLLVLVLIMSGRGGVGRVAIDTPASGVLSTMVTVIPTAAVTCCRRPSAVCGKSCLTLCEPVGAGTTGPGPWLTLPAPAAWCSHPQHWWVVRVWTGEGARGSLVCGSCVRVLRWGLVVMLAPCPWLSWMHVDGRPLPPTPFTVVCDSSNRTVPKCKPRLAPPRLGPLVGPLVALLTRW